MLSVERSLGVGLRAALLVVLKPLVRDLVGRPANSVHRAVGVHLEHDDPVDVLGQLALLKK